MALPWKRSEVDLLDVGIVAGALYLAWRWWTYGGPGTAPATSPVRGGTYPVALTADDLAREYQFSTVMGGKVIETGAARLKNAAPLVLAGSVNGRSTVPADEPARQAVSAYAAAKAAGTLPA